jgi:hypothetical protein
VDDLTNDELDTLNEWAASYESKYEFVGFILKDENTQ